MMTKERNPIDWQALLKLTNNNPELAKELVTMLGNELPEMRDKINQAYENQDYESLQNYVHQLHGSCCCTAAVILKEVSSTLEDKLQLQDNDCLTELMPQLNAEIQRLILTINQPSLEYE